LLKLVNEGKYSFDSSSQHWQPQTGANDMVEAAVVVLVDVRRAISLVWSMNFPMGNFPNGNSPPSAISLVIFFLASTSILAELFLARLSKFGNPRKKIYQNLVGCRMKREFVNAHV
jgi:hypothetical protein